CHAAPAEAESAVDGAGDAEKQADVLPRPAVSVPLRKRHLQPAAGVCPTHHVSGRGHVERLLDGPGDQPVAVRSPPGSAACILPATAAGAVSAAVPAIVV